jgi:hypothetical protein
MDATGLLGLLVVILAVDTVAIGALLVLTLRPPASADRRERWLGVAPTAPSRTRAVPMLARPPAESPLGAAAAFVGDRTEASPVPAGDHDPLADAISAFLGRTDGLFRAGGGGAIAAPEGPSDVAATVAATAASAGRLDPPATGPRPGPEMASPMRPSRYVASGSVPIDRSRPPEDSTGTAAPGPTGLPDSTGLPVPTAAPGPASPATGPGPDVPSSPVAPARPATRLSVALVGLDARPSVVAEAALVAAVARLSPVIGGLLRERSRSRDIVRVDGPGRFSVDLPETTPEGAAVLAARLGDSCESWLAAELPPLRLELWLADLTGRSTSSIAPTARPNGPERRRSLTLDA